MGKDRIKVGPVHYMGEKCPICTEQARYVVGQYLESGPALACYNCGWEAPAMPTLSEAMKSWDECASLGHDDIAEFIRLKKDNYAQALLRKVLSFENLTDSKLDLCISELLEKLTIGLPIDSAHSLMDMVTLLRKLTYAQRVYLVDFLECEEWNREEWRAY